MKHLPGITLIAVVLALSATFAIPIPAQETGNLSTLRQEALDLTNSARADAGLSELTPSDVLDQAAQDHAADMLAREYHDHVSPDGVTPFDRFIAAGGSSWALSGENIATCSGCIVPPDIDRVLAFQKGWMQSPGHRENILSDGFDSFGFGIIGEGSAVYAVQTFSGPGSDATNGGDPQPLTGEAARALALEHVNEGRATLDLALLEASDALDTVAERVLESLAADPNALPEDVFGLLPEGSNGWTSLALQIASLGGSGANLTENKVTTIVSDWASVHEGGQLFGGTSASHFGFAGNADGDGRISAVAVFAGRH